MKGLAVALLVLCASVSGARAQDADETRHNLRSVVDRVELEPSSITGLRLRIHLSALSLGGEQLDLSEPKSIKLFLGSSELKAPFSLGTFDGTNEDLAVVVLVQSTLDYTDVLPMIADSLDRDLLEALPDTASLVVLPYGEAASTGKLAAVKSLRGKISVSTDSSAGDPALLDTLDRALILLRKLTSERQGHVVRKIVVVIGDGRDAAADRERVTRTGQKAAKDGVRIHTLGFSASDVRRPLFTLGELSKQSMGTFRWVRQPKADSWSSAVTKLRDEIKRQYVLTYFVGPDDDVAGKKLKVVTVGRYETTSNEVKVPSGPTCGGADCATGYCAAETCVQLHAEGGRGVLGWLLLIGGIVVGAIVVLGLIGYLMSRAKQPRTPKAPKQQAQAQAQGAPAGAMPGYLPNGRPIPALLVLSGPRAGERHLLYNGFLIGKQPGCNLLIEDGFTSSQHAQVGMDATGACKLYDRGSTNGTYINGVRVYETPLQHGATIKIGSTELRFLAE